MKGEIDYYKPPVWTIIVKVVDAVIVAGLAVWGVFVFLSYKKHKDD